MQIVGTDTETGLIIPGNLCPPLVCMTTAVRTPDGSDMVRDLLDRRDSVIHFRALLERLNVCTVWQNGAYDLSVLVEEAELLFGIEYAESLLELIFQALHDGRISDIETREKLLLNERGLLHDVDDEGSRGIPLHVLVLKYLNIDITADKKDPDAWRLKYAELRDVPLELWPDDAVRYAQDDAVYNVLIHEKQALVAAETGYTDTPWKWLITDERRKVAKKFALHLMAGWGCRTDPERVDTISRAVADGMVKIEKLLLDEGLARLKTEKGVVSVSTTRRAVQDRVTLAYACEALGLDVDDIRRHAATYGVEFAPESCLERQDTTTRCLSYLASEHGVVYEGFPAIYPKQTKPEGGGIRAITPDGVLTTPSTQDPLEPSDRFPEGQVSWSRLTLLGSGDEALVLLGQQGEIQKLSSTYVPILRHGLVHPINPRYDEVKASGRSSCKSPNMQNLPTFGLYFVACPDGYLTASEDGWTQDKQLAGSWTGRRAVGLSQKLDPTPDKTSLKLLPVGGLRECFVARDGWALLDADIDFAECVAWAQWSIDTFGLSDMGDVINAGEDPHLHLALEFPQLGHLTYAEVAALKKSGDLLVKKMRQYAKSPGNFGCMGGMVAPTLKEAAIGYETFLTLDEAEMIVQAFRSRWQEAPLSEKWAKAQLRACGGESFTFVQPRSGRRRGGCTYTKGRNQAFQGGTADHADDVLAALAVACYVRKNSPLYGARPWAFAHDEFILEVPYEQWSADQTHAAGQELERIIIDSGKRWFPDVRVRTEAAMARRWMKDRRSGLEFKRVLDSSGRLIPMEDKHDRDVVGWGCDDHVS